MKFGELIRGRKAKGITILSHSIRKILRFTIANRIGNSILLESRLRIRTLLWGARGCNESQEERVSSRIGYCSLHGIWEEVKRIEAV